MVVGPLGNPRTGVASDLGMGDVYRTGWAVLRWPILLVIVVAFLVSLYRFSPNVRHCWRDCLPGALFGAALWIAAAIAFRVSAAIGLQSSRGVSGGDANVDIIGQSVNAVIATVLWAYLASIAILFGGEFNAVLRRRAVAAALEARAGHARRPGRPGPLRERAPRARAGLTAPGNDERPPLAMRRAGVQSDAACEPGYCIGTASCLPPRSDSTLTHRQAGTATVELRTSTFQAPVGSTRALPMSFVESIVAPA